ncbi:MAG: GTP pyrophosphokinase family protein [Oscillospiraceae bacterium]|nr:GTP pyrophosphokinase family protein [Oscillospiraceae bacterium]MBQ8978262.1 GTP pyrophosphokinase family protein [Oscillospiraceae bacterium]
MSVYGEYEETLETVLAFIKGQIEDYTAEEYAKNGVKLHEHLICRVKSDESMREKLNAKGFEETSLNALRMVYDSIGIRIVCSFLDDVFANIRMIREASWCEVIEEKDYITHAKPNGYRSYHMIIACTAPYEDIDGNMPGKFYAEVQLRTIAMDSWAALEHKMKYKKSVKNQALIVSELKRCADELASCDLSMQTIRQLIEEN